MEEQSPKDKVFEQASAPGEGAGFITPEFSWKRVGKIVIWIVGIGIVIGGVYFLFTSRPAKIFWADWALDRRENYLACENLPFYPSIQKMFSQHNDVVAKVKAVSGVKDFYPEEIRCDSSLGNYYFKKGQAVLVYKDRASREAAEKILGKDFFGIPYRGFAQ